MNHPGINRAIPGAILGFLIGEGLVLAIRSLQGLPAWDPNVALILAPFTLMAGWLWGIGAFNPKLSEHGDHGDEHGSQTALIPVDEAGNALVVADDQHHPHTDESASPTATFFNEIWKVASLPLVLLLIFFGFANIPGGFYLKQVDDATASPAAFAHSVIVDLPFVGTVETTQMLLFLAFVGWLLVSLLLVAGILGFLFYKGNEQIAIANEIDPGPRQTTPPAAVRALGRGAKNAARNTRKSLPKVFGNK